ncbi:MAG: Thiol peroxidase, Bcp-type [Myxococcaceae bacterium]|nr:Thiol peroxidase, Bcp-type [Myxococcaceae bacterium]
MLALLAACGGSKAHTDRSKLLAVGAEVPALVRVDQRGEVVSLRGAPATLLYFYPKDGTPGCTKEACAFRDAWSKYEGAGLRIVGVSFDDDESHKKFAEEHQLPFPLIADPEHTWSDAFGVGRFMGTADERVSFLIDASGHVVKVYEDVDPGVHADQVLADAKALALTK